MYLSQNCVKDQEESLWMCRVWSFTVDALGNHNILALSSEHVAAIWIKHRQKNERYLKQKTEELGFQNEEITPLRFNGHSCPLSAKKPKNLKAKPKQRWTVCWFKVFAYPKRGSYAILKDVILQIINCIWYTVEHWKPCDTNTHLQKCNINYEVHKKLQ